MKTKITLLMTDHSIAHLTLGGGAPIHNEKRGADHLRKAWTGGVKTKITLLMTDHSIAHVIFTCDVLNRA